MRYFYGHRTRYNVKDRQTPAPWHAWQGERGERFYLIQEGAVSVMRTNSAGDRQAMAKLGVGAYFGERALIRDEVRCADLAQLLWAHLLPMRVFTESVCYLRDGIVR